MTLDTARAWLAAEAPDLPIIEVAASTAARVAPDRLAELVSLRWIDCSRAADEPGTQSVA